MGLFSGKTKITVSSVTYNVAGEAKDRPSYFKQAMTFLVAANESISEKLPRMYLGSMGVKLNRAYKYAATSAQGLPSASIDLWDYQDFENAVQSILNGQYGAGKFKVLDAYLTQGSTAPAIEKYLNSKYGWDAITGKMASPPSGFSATDDVAWFQKTGDSAKNTRTYTIEFRHDPASVDADLTETVTLDADKSDKTATLTALVSQTSTSTRSDKTVSRPFQAGDTTHTTTNTTTATAGSRTTKTTTTVTMTTDGTTTKIRTKIVDVTTSEAVAQTYKLGTGQWPTLDAIWGNRSDNEQTYFPSVIFRTDNEDMFSPKYEDTEEYKAKLQICKYMNMDALTIAGQINENENVEDIDYAFLQCGANMNTDSQAEMDYLFRFWDLCSQQQTSTEADLSVWEALSSSVRGKPPTNRLVIKDEESGNGAYNIAIEWDWVKKTTVTGHVSTNAPVGRLAIVQGTSATYEYTTAPTRMMMDSSIVSIRKQISDTQYEEIQISGAVHKNDVYQGHTVETLAKDARSAPDDNAGFLIPLHMGIFNSMPMSKRTQLAQECVYMVFNCYVKVKQKWWQTDAFKWLLAIIAIIIIIVSWGSATPGVIAAWCAAYGAVAGLLLYIAINFAIGYMVSYLMGKWKNGFVSVFGEKWAGVVMAIIEIVVSAYTGGGAGSSQTWLQTAVQIIDIASQIFTAYVQGQMASMATDYNAFMKQAEADQKKLDALESEFFGDQDLISIDYLLRLQKTLREDSPSTFLTRTLLTGSDIVDITMGQISEMVPMNINPRLQGIS